MYDSLGHTVESEVFYNDFKDKAGELYLKDTGEDKSAVIYVKKF